ncbi:MAG: hypothetical protein DBY45_01890 [Clostridiales bacterium]|nr:MAG: hypothetical protein DBY45_01890 [Clostridiales bacterium]
MSQVRQCANDRCENWFVPKTAKQKYCCRKCCMSVINRAENKRLREQKKLEPPPDLNRPYTDDTVYLVHKWYREGMDSKEIGDLLMRSEGNVRQALRKPLTHEQEKTMSEYLCTSKRHTEA